MSMEIKIKKAALKLFATNGYESTTMREIGKEVGIRGSSLYSHFESKEKIFLEVVNDLFSRLVWEHIEETDLARVDGGIDLKTFLLKVFKSYYFFFAENELELMFWQRIRFFPPSNLKGTYDVNRLLNRKSILEIYTELFRKGIETKQVKGSSIELLVISFFVFISGFTDSLILSPSKLSEGQLEICFEMFWDGIRYRG